MIATTLICAALVGLGGLEGWLLRGLLKGTETEREAAQRSVIEMQLQAMRAAEQMSLSAWKARRELHELGRRDRD